MGGGFLFFLIKMKWFGVFILGCGLVYYCGIVMCVGYWFYGVGCFVWVVMFVGIVYGVYLDRFWLWNSFLILCLSSVLIFMCFLNDRFLVFFLNRYWFRLKFFRCIFVWKMFFW